MMANELLKPDVPNKSGGKIVRFGALQAILCSTWNMLLTCMG